MASAAPSNATLGLAYRAGDLHLPLVRGSIGEALRRAAQDVPDRSALAWSSEGVIESLTYQELLREAEQVAAWLLQVARPGDRICVWSRNSAEWVLVEYGAALAGMVVAAWNPGWTDFECAHARDLTTPAVILADCDTRGGDLLERARRLAPGRAFPLCSLREDVRMAPAAVLPDVKESDLFLIQFTSGTTGRAKGAALTHHAVLNAAWLRSSVCGADGTDVWVNAGPLHHVGGSVNLVLGTMVVRGCYVTTPKFDPAEMIRLIEACHATRIGGVPTMLTALLEHPNWRPGSYRLRSVGVGGTQVPQALITRLRQELGAEVLVTYAQSESPAITNSLPGDEVRIVMETVGRPLPHIEIKVCDIVTGSTVLQGEVGEICVRGPVVMSGYFRMEEATALAISDDGFLRTGDLGSLDVDGYVRIVGRSRDVIIRGGENIYPAEIEDILARHPDVAKCAVVGVADERYGHQVAAAVQLQSGVHADSAALEAYVGARLAHFKVPRQWLFVDSLPMTESGKVRKVEVEVLFEGNAR